MGGHHVPSRALTAELQGIQAEAAPGVQQGRKFGAASVVPTDCSHGQALARMSPAHCTSCPSKDWPPLARPSPETAQHWASSMGRAGRQPGQRGQEGGKTTTNKPARPVTEKETGGIRARCPAALRTGGDFGSRVRGSRATCPDGLSCPCPGATSPSRGLRAPQPPNIPVSSFICCLLLN